MSALHRSKVSLRFFGDDLDPDELTCLLGVPPTLGVRRGEPWKTGSGVSKAARTGSWRLHVEERSPGDLDGQVAWLFAELTDEIPVWLDLSSRFRADLFCGLFMAQFNEGVSLAPATLRAIGERRLKLAFDIYAHD